MLNYLYSRTRLAVAQDAIAKLSAGLPDDMNASLWVYGHRLGKEDKAASCKDIEEVIGLKPVDAENFDTIAHSFNAKGYTPITEALRLAAASLPFGENERNTIVLVSDGEETCNGDPCALAAELKAKKVHTIAFAAGDVARDQLKCIAAVTGGTFHYADSAEELSLALEEAVEVEADVASGVVEGLGGPASVVVSPGGKHVYVASASLESVVVFSRNPTTGMLTFVEVHRNGVEGVIGMDSPIGLAVSPDGRHVYVTGGDDLGVGIFSRDSDTGRLTFVEMQDAFSGVAGVDTVHSVVVSPDGKNVYLTGVDVYDTGEETRPADALTVFNRDADSGRLTLIEVHQNGIGGLEGLKSITGVTVSPDNKSVYAINVWRTVVVFTRNSDTGELTYFETQEDGVGGVVGLLGARVVTVSSDNEHLYVASGRGGAVTVFEREPVTGALTFIEAKVATVGSSGADLRGASGVAVSPDGGHVYVVTEQSDKLHVLSRNTDTGVLTYVETLTDNVGGVDGLEGSLSVVVSPDNIHVYVVGFYDNAVAVFSRDPSSGALTFVQVIRNAE
jgi:6-phosphogluconolactonase (cycloisomerase 2 family)